MIIGLSINKSEHTSVGIWPKFTDRNFPCTKNRFQVIGHITEQQMERRMGRSTPALVSGLSFTDTGFPVR